jgi:hypothetical protein
MIDIEKICSAPLLTDPWEHKIIDNFFPEDVFQKIRQAAQHLSKYAVEAETRPIWLHEAVEHGVDEDVVEDIITATDAVLDNINSIISSFTSLNSSTLGYYAMPKFGVSGKNFKYPIHSESNHKVLLFVIYLDPENDHGTRLYKEKTEESFAKEIEWKPNRAFLTCPGANDVTWHNWANSINVSRVTLNIFCEKLESLQTSVLNSAVNDEVKDILWLYDQFNKNRLTTNKI